MMPRWMRTRAKMGLKDEELLIAIHDDETKSKKRETRHICGYCGGSGKRQGSTALFPCPICGGDGRRPYRLRKKCVLCEGTGLRLGILSLPCPTCNGWGYTK